MLDAEVVTWESMVPTMDREDRFRTFVATHRERAVGLAWRLVGGDHGAAEDVAQEALLKAYRALPRFREESSINTWFYRILVREAHSYRRWRSVREAWTIFREGEIADPHPRGVGDPPLRRRIAEALDRLPRGQREAFVLVHMEGFTVQETAELLGKATGTVKSHLHRALVALRGDLADLQELTGGTQP